MLEMQDAYRDISGRKCQERTFQHFRPLHPYQRRSCASMHPRHTTAMEGGSVENEWNNFRPIRPVISRSGLLSSRDIHYIL